MKKYIYLLMMGFIFAAFQVAEVEAQRGDPRMDTRDPRGGEDMRDPRADTRPCARPGHSCDDRDPRDMGRPPERDPRDMGRPPERDPRGPANPPDPRAGGAATAPDDRPWRDILKNCREMKKSGKLSRAMKQECKAARKMRRESKK